MLEWYLIVFKIFIISLISKVARAGAKNQWEALTEACTLMPVQDRQSNLIL